MDQVRIECTCTIENFDQTGAVLRKQLIKKSSLELGRSEFGDVVIKLSCPDGKQGLYTIREYKLHKKFLHEGKATISLLSQKMQLMVSNCPMEQLRHFLYSLALKVAARGPLQGIRQHMSGDTALHFEEISPLNVRDLEMSRKNATLVNKQNDLTPRRTEHNIKKPTKRKLSESRTYSSDNNSSLKSDLDDGPPSKKPLLLRGSNSSLSEEQLKIINLVVSGKSVFFTGSAGTGKSFLLRRIIGVLPPETTYCTASTGAAACLIGGTTLHSFAGIGTGCGSIEQCITQASRDHKATHWKRCQVLIIDEISMVDGEYFDKLETVARAVRKSKKPFGGIQLVICGDFLQLPPVSKDGKKKLYCFQANSWRKCISCSMELTKVYRQDDSQFIAALQNIRIGRCPPAITKLLQSTENQKIEQGDISATRLYTHTADVDSTNQREMNVLLGESKKYVAIDNPPSLTSQINALCPASSILELKIGAQVMLVKNIDVLKGLVNGARGIVTSFETNGLPTVQFMTGQKETIGRETWTFHIGGGTVLSRKQVPLSLAWAISIHKSQGMTLDCVEMSLGKAFEKGQIYVALSRAKSLKSIRVKDFNPLCIQVDPEVLEYYRFLRRLRRNYIENKDSF